MLLKYRPVENDKDYHHIVNIEKAAFNRSFDFAIQNIKEAKKFLSDTNLFLVYNPKDQLVGYYSTKLLNKKTLEIVGIAILPKFQQKGIGSQIFKRILKDIKAPLVKIVTHPYNIAGLKLYFKFGFLIKYLKQNYYGDGQPRLILYKRRGK